jgi:helicase
MTRKELSNQFNSEPGDQFQISKNAEQLAYVIREIARFWKNKDLVREIDTLRQRIRHGISEKYLELVGLKNVGRVRAKALYKENFKNYADLRKAPLEKLAEIDNISMTIAKSIKSQV